MLLMWANHTIKSVDYVEKINRTLVISPWSRREDFTLGLPHNKNRISAGIRVCRRMPDLRRMSGQHPSGTEARPFLWRLRHPFDCAQDDRYL